MTYREFIAKLCNIYKLNKGMIDIYNEAFKGKTEFDGYWKKFVSEYYSNENPPMPSFWLKEEKEFTEKADSTETEKLYRMAEITKKKLEEERIRKFGS